MIIITEMSSTQYHLYYVCLLIPHTTPHQNNNLKNP